MRRISALVAIFFLAISFAARANWEFTRWNMSEDTLQSAARSQKLSLQTTTNQEKAKYQGPTIISPTGQTPDHPSSVADWKLSLSSYFDSTVYFLLNEQKKLVQITLIIPREQCPPFGQAMVKADGQPVENSDDNRPGGLIHTVWHSKDGDSIVVNWANPLPGSPQMDVTCTVDWSPTKRS